MIRILDRFCLGKPFKTCTHSIIYEAIDLRVQKSCLCKVYEYSRLSSREAAVLHREVGLIKRLRHPLLIQYLSVLHDHVGQRYLLFMEQIKQETLSQYIERRKRLDRGSHLPERNVWYILAQFIDLLSYLHSSEFDISPALLYTLLPESVFIDSLDIITVNFLSLSRKLAYHEFSPIHKAEYKAPELLRTGVASAQSDLWTLGCIMYEICTFKPFCLAINSMDAVQKLGKLQRKVQISRYSNSLISIINMLLELEPERRMTAEILSVNGIIREMIQSYKSRLESYGFREKEEVQTIDKVESHALDDNQSEIPICSTQEDDESSLNLLCTQTNIESLGSSEIAIVPLDPTATVEAHHIARYNDILLLDFSEKRGCSILDDSLLANKQQLRTRNRKRTKKHNPTPPEPIAQPFVQDKGQGDGRPYVSFYEDNVPAAHQSSVMVGLDDNQSISLGANTRIESGSNSVKIVSNLRKNCFDSTVYSVKTPHMSQFIDNTIKHE